MNCDPDRPCEKCGRTLEDIERRRRGEARGAGLAGAIHALLMGKSPVRRDAFQLRRKRVRDGTVKSRPMQARYLPEIGRFSSVGMWCRARGLCKR